MYIYVYIYIYDYIYSVYIDWIVPADMHRRQRRSADKGSAETNIDIEVFFLVTTCDQETTDKKLVIFW